MKNLGSQQGEVICTCSFEPGIAFQILSGEPDAHQTVLNKNIQYTLTAFITVSSYITKKTTPKMIVNVKLSIFSIIRTGCGKKIWIVTTMNWKQHYQNNWNLLITCRVQLLQSTMMSVAEGCRHVLNAQISFKIGHLANILLKTASFCLGFSSNAKIIS